MSNEHNRFKKMVESSQDWFWEFDEHANFTYVSPSIRDLLGYEPEELIGRNAFELMDPDEAERVHNHFDPIAKKYLPFSNLVNINIHKDGHEVVIESSGTPIFGEDGRFLGYRGIDRDITQRRKVKEELRENKEKLQNILENSSEWIWEIDLSGRHTYSNNKIIELLGYRPEELVGKGYFDFLHKEDLQEVEETLPKLIAEKRGWNSWILRWRHRDGSYRYLESNAQPIINVAGDMVGYCGADRDVTERKVIEENYRRLATLTSDYVHYCTRSGKSPYRVQWVDGAVNSISGYKIEEVLSLGCWLPLVHPDDRSAVDDYLRSLKPGDRKSIEFRILTQQKEIRWVSEQSHCEAGPSEGEMILLGAVTDITERKNAEIRLKESNEELDAFVQTVAHDLRTPILPIIGYAEILRESCKDKLDEQALSYLTEIEKSGEEMLALMENLLSLARAGTFKRPIECVSTDEVVARVIENLTTNISCAGVILQINPLPPVHVPKAFLTQVFDNLIGNAIRYAGKIGGQIEVGGEQTGKQVRFYVRDHGPGISEQERKHIFEIFYRGTNKGDVKGSGIGLAIVYKIARNCGGRAWVEETQGGGCTFWVEMENVPRSEKAEQFHMSRSPNVTSEQTQKSSVSA